MSITIGSNLNQFIVLASSTVTNTGSTVILGKTGSGDVGLYPGTSVTGFPPGFTSGGVHAADALAGLAQVDLTNLYTTLASATPTEDLTGQDLGGKTLGPGVYSFSTSASIATVGEVLTLNGAGTYIFQIGSSLTTASSSSVVLTGGAKSCQIFWQVGSSATLGTDSTFNGVIAAQISITVTTGATIQCGTVYARTGAVTLDANTIHWDTSNIPNCSCTGGDPHCVCLDGSRIDLYNPGFYRLFDNCSQDDLILINAEVKRKGKNSTDYYHQVWVKTQNATNTNEYLLEFEEKQIKILNKITGETSVGKQWNQDYTTIHGDTYTFKCDSQYNTVTLNKNGSVLPFKCSGLLAGMISPIACLTDDSETEVRKINPNFYEHNSLLSASAHPHVVTVQGKRMVLKRRTVRLLQWKTTESQGTITGTVDGHGLLRKLRININEKSGENFNSTWSWIGPNHWFLFFMQDGKEIKRQLFEKEFMINKNSSILVRVQRNAALSISFKNIDSSVRGVMVGDVIKVTSIDDTEVYRVGTPLSLNAISVRKTTSDYERMIEPHIIAVA